MTISIYEEEDIESEATYEIEQTTNRTDYSKRNLKQKNARTKPDQQYLLQKSN